MLLWTVRQRNACDGIICNDWKTVLFERGESETDCGEKKIAINSNKWWNSPTKKGVYVYLCSGFRNERLTCEFRKTRDTRRKQLTSRSVSRSQWPMPCIVRRLLFSRSLNPCHRSYARRSLSNIINVLHLRSILEPTRFSDGDEGIPLCGRKR